MKPLSLEINYWDLNTTLFNHSTAQLRISSRPAKWYMATLKAVCHVSDWPLQSELSTTDFFVNLCI